MKLYYKGTDREVKVGDETTTFRGAAVRVTRINLPLHYNSTGSVDVTYVDDGIEGIYYPSVINAEWRES